jgi:hypothetical protein
MALFIAAPAAAETLTNDTVIALSASGLGDEAVIAKIKSSQVRFDLTTDHLIALRGKGVTGPVIAAMIEAASPAAKPAAMSMDSPDPMVPHPSGLYLLAGSGGQGRMQRIDVTVSNQAKTGGIFGYALTGGIASMSVKAAIQNDTARVKASSKQPVFYFFFDESNPTTPQASGWLSGSTQVATSPNEFTLVKLNKKKGRREARVGSMNIAGAKTGVMDSDRIAFDYEMVRPGVFKAVPKAPLEAGEYGFIQSISGGGAGGALTARIFDFSVL